MKMISLALGSFLLIGAQSAFADDAADCKSAGDTQLIRERPTLGVATILRLERTDSRDAPLQIGDLIGHGLVRHRSRSKRGAVLRRDPCRVGAAPSV